MDLQSISIVVGFIALLSALSMVLFRTKSDCGKCQSDCREKIYKKIYEKADKEDMKKLESHYITIITEIAKLSTIVSINKGQ